MALRNFKEMVSGAVVGVKDFFEDSFLKAADEIKLVLGC